VVEALMILHNILLELGDTPDIIEDYDPVDPQASALEDFINNQEPPGANEQPDLSRQSMDGDTRLRVEGQELREVIMELMGI
jgi:hypothetical protein